MKQVLLAMAITIFACTSAEAQTKCETVAPNHKTAVRHKSATQVTRQTTSRVTACHPTRYVPYCPTEGR